MEITLITLFWPKMVPKWMLLKNRNTLSFLIMIRLVTMIMLVNLT